MGKKVQEGLKSFKILLIAYYFPPLGGPASIRLGKLCKYLRKSGIEVDVISVKNILYHSYDYELAAECKPNHIEYASSYDLTTILYIIKKIWSLKFKYFSGKKDKKWSDRNREIYFCLPEWLRLIIKKIYPVDDKILWLYSAQKVGLKLLRSNNYDVIVASMGPYTSGLVGYKLSKKTGTPLLIDYRDHMTMNPYEIYLTPLHRHIAEKYEKKIIKQSTYLTCIGETMHQELTAKYREDFPTKSTIIYNGFDESDFVVSTKKNNIPSKKVDAKIASDCVLTYTGNFYQQRTPYYFCQALLLLKKENRLPQDLKIRFVGNYHRDAEIVLRDKNLKDLVEVIPYQTHRKCLGTIMESTGLLLFIPSKDGAGVLTSKIFEYLRSGKPILAMVPQAGEAARIINNYPSVICSPQSVENIAESIVNFHSEFWRKQTENHRKLNKDYPLSNSICKFSREKQTQKFMDLLQ